MGYVISGMYQNRHITQRLPHTTIVKEATMKRIGIAASKISEGNILLYNIFVLVLSTLFSLLIFFLSGFAIFLAIYSIHALSTGLMPFDFHSSWGGIVKSCMMALTVIVGVFNLCAIGLNLKIKL